jgi:hypothetical protein
MLGCTGIALSVCALLHSSHSVDAAPGISEPGRHEARVRVAAALGELPLSFEANRGQSDPRVKYLVRGAGYAIFLTGDGAVLALRATAGNTVEGAGYPPATLEMKFAGTSGKAIVVAADELPGHVNYLIGNDPSGWRTNVPTYGQVMYTEVYPGIAVVFHGRQRELEYDFEVGPGADASRIGLEIQGAKGIRLEGDGNAVVETAAGQVVLRRPVSYQEISGKRNEVASAFELRGEREVGIRLGAYDSREKLVIDPVLSYSTFLGGTGEDQILGVDVDASGDTYVTGTTSSTSFPIVAGYQPIAPNTTQTAFVTELNAAGSALVYSTYLGGSTFDAAQGIRVDASGNAYVAGLTESANFPVTASAFQGTLAGVSNCFLAVLNAGGQSLKYSSYLGGNGSDHCNGVAVDSASDAYVTGATSSTNFPVTAGAPQGQLGGGGTAANNAFVSEISTNGSGTSSLVYSTYLGGSVADTGNGIAVDTSGNAYVSGSATSTDFPITTGAFQTVLIGAEDGFAAKIDAGGKTLGYSTLLGGLGSSFATGIAVDSSGDAYLTGQTTSSSFPVSTGAVQPSLDGTSDAFVTEFNPAASALVFSTYLGGGEAETAWGIALDSSSDVYVGGTTTSVDFPLASPLFSANLAASIGEATGFLTEYASGGGSLLFSTYFGGSGRAGSQSNGDVVHGIVVDASGNIYVAGIAASLDFPTMTPEQAVLAGQDDGFISKIGPGSGSTVIVTPASLTFPAQADGTPSATQAVTLNNASGALLTISSITVTGTNAGDFAETNTCGASVAIGALCTIEITFTPSIAGVEIASLVVASTPTAPPAVPLTGTGEAASLGASLSPTSLTYPSTPVGITSAVQTATLTNTGNEALAVSGVTFTGPNGGDFFQTNTCGSSLAVGATCVIAVSFKPSVVGAESATMNVFDNAPSSPQTLALTGTGALGTSTLTVTPTSFSFPPQLVTTTSAAQTVTVTNTGNQTVTISGITLMGTNASEFQQGNTCGTSLGAASSCLVNVTFAPRVAGNETATLNVLSNSAGSPQTVALTGSGTDFSLTVTPPTLTMMAGSSGMYTVTATSLNSFAGNISINCTGLVFGTTCLPANATLSVTASSPATTTLTVTTTAASFVPPAGGGKPWIPGVSGGSTSSVLVVVALMLWLLGFWRLRKRRTGTPQAERLAPAAVLGALLTIAGLLVACGGGISTTNTATPVGTYTLTVTGTSGTDIHSVPVTLVVN